MKRLDGVDMSPHCQRCGSTNTKFCYYNNYSLAQPRYFCKGCRRYWTKGGSLRNVPVGGGSRKSRRGRDVSLSRYHHHSSPSKSPLSYSTSLDASCVAGNSSTSNIDLAAVYANFLKQDSLREPEPAKDLPKVDSLTNPSPCSRTVEMRTDAVAFELPPLPNVEGMMFSQAGDWFESQMQGSNEGPLAHIILPDKFSYDIHDINQLVDNWSSFNFAI